jgi:hypothetical protein
VVCESHLGTHSQQYVDVSSQKSSASWPTARLAVRAYAVFVRRPASEADIQREINRIRQVQ